MKIGVYGPGPDRKLLDTFIVPDDLSYLPPLTVPKGGSVWAIRDGVMVPLVFDCPEKFRVAGVVEGPN